MNDDDREVWVLNDEGLYNLQRRSRLSMRKWVRANRSLIDEVAEMVKTGKKSAHFMAYEKTPAWIRGKN
jgi:hypothetical protein